jgi:hypothetical protein
MARLRHVSSNLGELILIVPIAYERDDHRRLITLTASDPYSVEDILSVIDRQAAEDTLGYAMFYDLRGVRDTSALAGLQQIADRVGAVGGGRARAPVGVAILARPELFLAGLMYVELTREVMAVEVLLTAAQLDDWLTRNARPGPSRPHRKE